MKRLAQFLFITLSTLISSQLFAQSPLFPQLGISQVEAVSFIEHTGFISYSVDSENLVRATRGPNHLEYRFEPNMGLSQVVLYQNLESKKQAVERYKFIVNEYIVTCVRNASNPNIKEWEDHGELSTTFTMNNQRIEILLMKNSKKSKQLKIIKSDLHSISHTALSDFQPSNVN